MFNNLRHSLDVLDISEAKHYLLYENIGQWFVQNEKRKKHLLIHRSTQRPVFFLFECQNAREKQISSFSCNSLIALRTGRIHNTHTHIISWVKQMWVEQNTSEYDYPNLVYRHHPNRSFLFHYLHLVRKVVPMNDVIELTLNMPSLRTVSPLSITVQSTDERPVRDS